jgi:hypothetical protein
MKYDRCEHSSGCGEALGRPFVNSVMIICVPLLERISVTSCMFLPTLTSDTDNTQRRFLEKEE